MTSSQVTRTNTDKRFLIRHRKSLLGVLLFTSSNTQTKPKPQKERRGFSHIFPLRSFWHF